jgi:hypothetical protein
MPRQLFIAYCVAGIWAALAGIHFFPIGEAHEALLLISILPTIACMILGLRVRPREMRPALLAFLGIWIHVVCFVLSDRFGWEL